MATDTLPTTHAECETASPAFKNGGVPKTRLIRLGGGLLLQITPSKVAADDTYSVSRSFLFRYCLDGCERRKGLGSVTVITLDEARSLSKLVAKKIDPLDQDRREREQRHAVAKRVEARSKTFRECAEEYIAAHEKGWTNESYREYWKQTLVTYVYPLIGSLRVADVDRKLVKDVLTPLWNTKTKSAKDLRGRISKVLGWAIAEGLREGPNPAAWRENLVHSFAPPGAIAPPKPFEALSYKDVPTFMKALRQTDTMAARALEFAILTAARTGEVRFSRWSEIDWDEQLWTVPKARMKMRRNPWVGDHVVPLSDDAMAILTALKGDEKPDPKDYIFATPADRPIAQNGMMRTMQRIWPTDPKITVHGFRSAFSDFCGDVAEAPEEVREFALAHIKRGVEGGYRRKTAVEARRVLMQRWANYCAGGNVVPLKRSA